MKKAAFIYQPEHFRFYSDDLFETREFPFKYDMTEKEFDLKSKSICGLSKSSVRYEFYLVAHHPLKV